MRKCPLFLLLLLMSTLVFPTLSAYAADTDIMQDSLYDAAHTDSLPIPEDLQTLLDQHNASLADPASLLNLSPGDFCSALWHMITRAATEPLRLLGSFLILTMLSAGLGGLGDALSERRELQRLFHMLCTLVCVGTAAVPLCHCLTQTASALEDARVFMVSYIPIFTAFITASGHMATGMGYQTFLFFLVEGIGLMQTNLLYPAIQAAAALGLADCINPAFALHKIVESIRKGVIWLLVTVTTLFTALLSARSFVSVSADGLSAKTVKMLSAGLIPVVGSAVSEAYGTLQGSLRLMRSGVGVVGILAILWLMLPPVLSLLLYRLVFSVAALPAEMIGAESMARLYRNGSAVLTAAFAILVVYTMMMTFSTALMLILLHENG